LQGNNFVIKIDHVDLKYFFEQKLNVALQHKGLCKLMGLDYTIHYKKGYNNVVTDALSKREEEIDMTV
jgi:hypothetical protein